MKRKLFTLSIAAVVLMVSGCHVAQADTSMDPLKEYRYCAAQPSRTAQGKIARSREVLAAFQRIHPCPATGLRTGACPNWALNHVIPLANGGCDAVYNLQWMPAEIKSCAGPYCEDRFERKIYMQNPPVGKPLVVFPAKVPPGK